jgi:hypothetical protein
VEDRLLEDSADDGADLAARVGRVGGLLGGRAVRVLDRPPGAFQPREEGVDLGDVALVQAQLAELGRTCLWRQWS